MCSDASPTTAHIRSRRFVALRERSSTEPAMCRKLQIKIDRARAARYGPNVADVEDVIETALGGKTATELRKGERRFNVVVRLREEEGQDGAAIANVLVETPHGLSIPLSEGATISVGSGSMNIARESGMRVAAIGSSFRATTWTTPGVRIACIRCGITRNCQASIPRCHAP